MDEHRGWYEGKYLPHLDVGGKTQFITYRLGDSIPAETMERLQEELERVKGDKEIERKRRIERLLDLGSGSCILREPQYAEIVQNAIKFLDGKRYTLETWVVMPNHVHMLAYFAQGQTLEKALHSLKSYTSNILGEIHPEVRQFGRMNTLTATFGLTNTITEPFSTFSKTRSKRGYASTQKTIVGAVVLANLGKFDEGWKPSLPI